MRMTIEQAKSELMQIYGALSPDKQRAIDTVVNNSQEPKIGHWIEHEWEEMREKGYYRCSVCNCGYQRWTKGIRKSDVPYIDGKEYTLRNIDHYCPNCGCRMKGELE